MDEFSQKGQKLRLGEILISAGLLAPEALERALECQKNEGGRLGYILMKKLYVTEGQLVQALSKQLSVPWVSLRHLEITESLKKLVPADVAGEFGVVPVYIMSKRGGGKTLYVAMDDPTNSALIEKISMTAGMEVKPMISAPSEIVTAIRRFYHVRWETGEKLIEDIKSALSSLESRKSEEIREIAEEAKMKGESGKEGHIEEKKEYKEEIGRIDISGGERMETGTQFKIEGACEVVLLPESAMISDEGELKVDDASGGGGVFMLPQEMEIKESIQKEPVPVDRENGGVKDEIKENEENMMAPEEPSEMMKKAEIAVTQKVDAKKMENEVKEDVLRKPLTFTFLNGTKIFFTPEGKKVITKKVDEYYLLDKLRENLKAEGGKNNQAEVIIAILEVLLKRGLITFEEIESMIREKLQMGER